MRPRISFVHKTLFTLKTSPTAEDITNIDRTILKNGIICRV